MYCPATNSMRWLPGNVGYLRIGMFMNAEASVEKLAAAMTMLVDTGALIVDVRFNKGGYLANTLTPFVGDANTYTPEFKAFLVKIERA